MRGGCSGGRQEGGFDALLDAGLNFSDKISSSAMNATSNSSVFIGHKRSSEVSGPLWDRNK